MNALAIDCAVSKIAVAAKKDTELVKVTLDIGMKQSEKLLPAIDYVMKEAGLTPQDLDFTACTLGPGSFTGLRLGLSALKALTLSHDVPLYGIPSLEAYAWPYRSSPSTVLSLIESKEDEYFFSIFSKGNKILPETDGTEKDVLSHFDEESEFIICGPGAKWFSERTAESSPLYKSVCFLPQNDACEALLEIAEDYFKNKKDPLSDYEGPLYVRKSEAEIVLEKKNSAVTS